MNNKKNTQNNILIIGSIIFVTIAVIVFVISLSLLNNGRDGDSSSNGQAESSSAISESSSIAPQSSSDAQESSSQAPESSSLTPQSSSKTPESSSQTPQSSSNAQGSSSKTPQSSSSSVEMSRAQVVLENARLLIGTPFKDGGEDKDGFDSSGFIYYVMRESGFITCPRNIVEQSKMGVIHEFDELEVGDALFFSNEIGGSPNFAGFYSGDGKMIGCIITSSFEGVVEVNIMNNYYSSHFVAGVGIG